MHSRAWILEEPVFQGWTHFSHVVVEFNMLEWVMSYLVPWYLSFISSRFSVLKNSFAIAFIVGSTGPWCQLSDSMGFWAFFETNETYTGYPDRHEKRDFCRKIGSRVLGLSTESIATFSMMLLISISLQLCVSRRLWQLLGKTILCSSICGLCLMTRVYFCLRR